MTKKEIDKISFKISKEDYELRTMMKRMKQKKLNISDISKKALKFYFNHMLSSKSDPVYEKMILESERRKEAAQLNEHMARIKEINKRLGELNGTKE
jgi:hypothetical protein